MMTIGRIWLSFHLFDNIGYKRPIKTLGTGTSNLSWLLAINRSLVSITSAWRITHINAMARELWPASTSAACSTGRMVSQRYTSFECRYVTSAMWINIRILHVTNVEAEAQKYLLAVRRQFRRQWAHHWGFRWLDERRWWSNWVRIIRCRIMVEGNVFVRRSNSTLKDPTLQAIGAGQAIYR